jgi:hypothetical protein
VPRNFHAGEVEEGKVATAQELLIREALYNLELHKGFLKVLAFSSWGPSPEPLKPQQKKLADFLREPWGPLVAESGISIAFISTILEKKRIPILAPPLVVTGSK